MHTAPPGVTTEIPPNGRGQAAVVRISQQRGDPGGQLLRVMASCRGESTEIGSVVVSPSAGLPGARIACGVYAPGTDYFWCLVTSTVAQFAAGTLQIEAEVDHDFANAPSGAIGLTSVNP